MICIITTHAGISNQILVPCQAWSNGKKKGSLFIYPDPPINLEYSLPSDNLSLSLLYSRALLSFLQFISHFEKKPKKTRNSYDIHYLITCINSLSLILSLFFLSLSLLASLFSYLPLICFSPGGFLTLRVSLEAEKNLIIPINQDINYQWYRQASSAFSLKADLITSVHDYMHFLHGKHQITHRHIHSPSNLSKGWLLKKIWPVFPSLRRQHSTFYNIQTISKQSVEQSLNIVQTCIVAIKQ